MQGLDLFQPRLVVPVPNVDERIYFLDHLPPQAAKSYSFKDNVKPPQTPTKFQIFLLQDLLPPAQLIRASWQAIITATSCFLCQTFQESTHLAFSSEVRSCYLISSHLLRQRATTTPVI